jgi:hypothetical protein
MDALMILATVGGFALCWSFIGFCARLAGR